MSEVIYDQSTVVFDLDGLEKCCLKPGCQITEIILAQTDFEFHTERKNPGKLVIRPEVLIEWQVGHIPDHLPGMKTPHVIACAVINAGVGITVERSVALYWDSKKSCYAVDVSTSEDTSAILSAESLSKALRMFSAQIGANDLNNAIEARVKKNARVVKQGQPETPKPDTFGTWS